MHCDFSQLSKPGQSSVVMFEGVIRGKYLRTQSLNHHGQIATFSKSRPIIEEIKITAWRSSYTQHAYEHVKHLDMLKSLGEVFYLSQ